MEASAECEKTDELPGLQAPVALHLVEEYRNGRGRGVATAIDVARHLFRRNAEAFADRFQRHMTFVRNGSMEPWMSDMSDWSTRSRNHLSIFPAKGRSIPPPRVNLRRPSVAHHHTVPSKETHDLAPTEPNSSEID